MQTVPSKLIQNKDNAMKHHQFKQLLDNNNEFGQSIARTVFGSFIFLYIYLKSSSELGVYIAGIYWLFALAISTTIFIQQTENTKRQWVMMFIDITTISLGIAILGELSTILLGIYLWVCLGYGLRYGPHLFKGTYLASLTGFCVASYNNPFWLNHSDLKLGFVITLILVPVYVLKLLLKFEKAKQQADAANEAKSNFLSHISHEIRTPLNGVVVASELLLQTKQDKKQKELSHMMHASAVSLKKLITDVLDISKIEQGKIELEMVCFNLKSSLEHVYDIFQIEAKRKGIAFNLHLDPQADQYLEGSVGHIEQVLMNLVANAIKFTDRGTVDLFVTIVPSLSEKREVVFKIKDSGIGMDANALAHIFETFKQADSSINRRYGGTGLGTSIAKQLVEMMGGSIEVSSAQGIGSLFTVKLTLNHSQQVAQEEPINRHFKETSPQHNIVKLSAHHKFSKKMRVLIADDNVINRMILLEVLQKNGCIVKAVNDGSEALDALEQHQFDMMILDYNMPEHTGLEVFKIHHALAGVKPVRSVILTADATAKTRDECLNAGVYSVFTKPIITKQINQLIKTYLAEQDDAIGNNNKDEQTSTASQAIHLVKSDTDAHTYIEPLVDQNRMEHLIKLGNGEPFLIKLLTEFIEASDLALTELKEECAELNFEKIQVLAHSLAGESANMGLMPLSKHCRTLMGLTILDTQYITQRLDMVERTYMQSRAQLQTMLKTLSTKRSKK